MTSSPTQFEDEALDSIAKRLRDAGTPLETVDPTAPLGDLEPLREPLTDATVVGLGEASHGTREFFRFKHRLFRFLVEELDYRLLALEEDFTTARPLNEYVTEGLGDPREALLYDPIVHPWKVESMLALVEWIRSFNDGRDPDDQIRLHGFDMQAGHETKDGLVSYFEQVDESALSEIDDAASAIDDASLYIEGDESDQRRYVEAHGEVATTLKAQLTTTVRCTLRPVRNGPSSAHWDRQNSSPRNTGRSSRITRVRPTTVSSETERWQPTSSGCWSTRTRTRLQSGRTTCMSNAEHSLEVRRRVRR